ncbi:undecaprenyl diphosphate synthase family protein, partial [Candidatus Woesearchaeota archaeon]|nr:undecaprenyl diphosphate synthase family protein [Candidatus Woesearchaeota archaeon]
HLYDKHYFEDNEIRFQWIDHSSKLPTEIVDICQSLEEKTKQGIKTSLNLLGYDLETDEKNAFNQAENYNQFKANRLIPNIDLVLRTTEMRPSKGPVYAMAQSQMLLLEKLNPELERIDLEKILQEYNSLVGYRQTTNPIHK